MQSPPEEVNLPQCHRMEDLPQNDDSGVPIRTKRSTKCHVPCLGCVRDGLEGRPKVGGVGESGICGDPDIANDR